MVTRTVLATWECGGGYGHLMPLKSFIDRFLARGCRVALASRDLVTARRVFPDSRVVLLPAPYALGAPAQSLSEPCTFADVLHNVGCADRESCPAVVRAWRSLLELVRPDVMLCEYSPFSLLALRSFPGRVVGAKRVMTLNAGTGFYCPPDVSPLPDWRPWLKTDRSLLASREQEVLAACQDAVVRSSSDAEARDGISLMQRLTDLFTQVDETLLLTYRELDPFENRGAGVYGGYATPQGSMAPGWPSAARPRIFAYLRNFSGLAGLLHHWTRHDCSVLAHIPDLPDALRVEFRRPNIVFFDGMANLKSVLEDADLVVNYGSHGTVCASLLAGKPMLLIPTDLEKRLTALAVTKIGAGLFVDSRQMGGFAESFEKVTSQKRFETRASEFASRYAERSRHDSVEECIERLWARL